MKHGTHADFRSSLGATVAAYIPCTLYMHMRSRGRTDLRRSTPARKHHDDCACLARGQHRMARLKAGTERQGTNDKRQTTNDRQTDRYVSFIGIDERTWKYGRHFESR